MKEPVVASRDVRKGEQMNKVVNREDGFFYFVTAEGTMQRAPYARKKLTQEQRAARDKAQALYKKGVAERRVQRANNRALRSKADLEAKEARKKERQAKLDKKIAALHQAKAKL